MPARQSTPNLDDPKPFDAGLSPPNATTYAIVVDVLLSFVRIQKASPLLESMSNRQNITSVGLLQQQTEEPF